MKKWSLLIDRETVVMVLSCLIIVGACFGYIGYKAMMEKFNDNKFAKSIENWFDTDAKSKYGLLTSYECDQTASDCSKLRLTVEDSFNLFSIVEKYDYITDIAKEYKVKRIQFLVDSKIIEDTMYVQDRVQDPSIILATSTDEFEYHGSLRNLKVLNGREYTWSDISELREQVDSINESSVIKESKSISPKNKQYNAEDYNYEGEYKPVDQMTQQEKREELIEMLERAVSQ